jgi:serine/threonine-protein kinase
MLTPLVRAQAPKEKDASLPPQVLAAQVKEIFRAHCLECHGGKKKQAGLSILDRGLLVDKKKVIIPSKPDESELMARIIATDESRMPEPPNLPLASDQVELIRKWIAAGATDFPADIVQPKEEKPDPAFQGKVGIDHIHRHILEYVRKLPAGDRAFVRFFSFNHILTGGATAEELTRQRDALIKALNHLSRAEELYIPPAIDAPVNTVYAVDIRKLGWDLQPYHRWVGRNAANKSDLNLFDLILLEYPYGIFYPNSELFDHLVEEYLVPTRQARPVAYIRSDWFASVGTLSPLYEDLLQLPLTLGELEQRLGVDAGADLRQDLAWRAGMTISGVSRNNRVVERHPARGVRYYWKSFDFRTSKGSENMFKDPIDLHPTGGEMIFGLPNGLQAYYVADGAGNRLEAAPTEIVTDKFASDHVVRNGLGCIRCHDQGMKDLKDSMRPALLKLPAEPGFDKRAALQLYPEKDLENELKKDRTRFQTAQEKLFGRKLPPGYEPLIAATRRYLDDSLTLQQAAGELGLAEPGELAAVFRVPHFTALGLIPLSNGGVIRRDAWEDYFDQVVQNLGLGRALPALDGLLRRDFPAGKAPLNVELKTNHKNNLFTPGDDLIIEVVNRSLKQVSIELIGVGIKGEKVVLTSPGLTLDPGQSYKFLPNGKPITIKGGLGKESIILFASEDALPAGELVRADPKPGFAASDRVLHGFERLEQKNGHWRVRQLGVVLKKTLDIETR